MPIQKIRPFLWYDSQAEEAAKFYCSVFKDSRILKTMPGPDPKTPQGVEFELEGRQFIAFNGGPHLQFSAATSMFINCETQVEVDYYWEKLLSGGGKPTQCGWLEDRFGLSWQVIPTALMKLLGDKDRAAAGRAMQAMLKMQKIDVAGLQRAFDGK
jgi:predicted 3-demethylubiquinone-9 3-methyltransferase (glyoxalase superfamily)